MSESDHAAESFRRSMSRGGATGSVIVVGSLGASLGGDALLGSTAHSVLQSAQVPILLVRLEITQENGGRKCQAACQDYFRHILFPTDFSDNAGHAFLYLEHIARETNTHVTLLHVQDQARIERHLKPGPANEATPGLGAASMCRHSPTASACEPHRDFIELSLSQGRNAKAIYQELADDHGFRASYQSVKRFAGKLRDSAASDACPVIVTPPGEELQVDYSTGAMVRDPHTGRYRRTRMFVLTLGYSRNAVHLLTFTSSTQTRARQVGGDHNAFKHPHLPVCERTRFALK